MRLDRIQTAVMLLALLATAPAWAVPAKNGFDLSGALVPADEILSGGPPRDGIPAIDHPRFLRADVSQLQAESRVLGVVRNGHSKAYPVAILNWHEIVNDRFGTEPIVVTFCPLCGSGVAFSATTAGAARTFGVSGLLYNSDVLLYDRQTDSLWSQMLAKAIAGPLKGTGLRRIPLAHTTWADWRARHPDTLVLSRDTGYRRDYDRDPYAGYRVSGRTFFPVSHRDGRFHPKEQVIGVQIGGAFKAYPFSELSKTTGDIRDRMAGQTIRIRYNAEHRSGIVFDNEGREISSTVAFWFAWYTFHPETAVYRAQ